MKTIFLMAPFIIFLGACSLLVDFGNPKTPTERDCDDERDNDGDGFTDCDDQDCETDEACTGPNINNLNNVYNNFNNIVGPEICDDGHDNDGDGLYDCDDAEDCFEHPFCAPPEDCFDSIDNDHDGLIDCADDDCWHLESCNLPGEHDCGDGLDNEDTDGVWPPEGDGRIDCQDPECSSNPICFPGLVRCNDTVEHDNSFETIYYYKDIYHAATSGDCPENHYCTVRPELSRVPYCFPMSASTPVPAYGVCGPTLKCGTGLVCAWSDTLSQSQNSNVCLPFCAPGHMNTCIGNTGLCYRRMEDAFDGFLGLFVETWMCDHPVCDPMAPTGSTTTCADLTSGCYPTTDLMGGAFCHQNVGVGVSGTPCTGNDLLCQPGLVCRQGPLDGGVSRCHPLCRTDGQCNQGSACVKTDNRQFFGFCK